MDMEGTSKCVLLYFPHQQSKYLNLSSQILFLVRPPHHTDAVLCTATFVLWLRPARWALSGACSPLASRVI